MIYKNIHIDKIRDVLQPGDTLVSCFAPQQTSGTDLCLPEGLIFDEGLYSNCKRPAGCTGWETVMSAQYRTETQKRVIQLDSGEIEIEEEVIVPIASSWEAIQ